MDLVLAIIIVMLLSAIGVVAYYMFIADVGTAEETVRDFATLPGVEGYTSLEDSRSVQSFILPGRYYTLTARDDQQTLSLDSCWRYNSAEGGAYSTGEERMFRVHRGLVVSSQEDDSSLNELDQEITVACDYSALDIATLSVGGRNVFDELWPRGEIRTVLGPEAYSLQGFGLSIGDSLDSIAKDVLFMSESCGKDVLKADVTVSIKTTDTKAAAQSGVHEITAPAYFFVEKGLFGAKTVERWKAVDHSFDFYCADENCSTVTTTSG